MADHGNNYRTKNNTHAMETMAMRLGEEETVYMANKSSINDIVKADMYRWIEETIPAKQNGNRVERKKTIHIGGEDGEDVDLTKKVIGETLHHNQKNGTFPMLMEELKHYEDWIGGMKKMSTENNRHNDATKPKYKVYITTRGHDEIVVKWKDVKNPVIHFMTYEQYAKLGN